MGDLGLSDDAITGPHHQIQSVEKIAILYWPRLVSDKTDSGQTDKSARWVEEEMLNVSDLEEHRKMWN